jgi:hypothetical protein
MIAVCLHHCAAMVRMLVVTLQGTELFWIVFKSYQKRGVSGSRGKVLSLLLSRDD